eukprot:4421408-Pyramimonas_sp.AAC.1
MPANPDRAPSGAARVRCRALWVGNLPHYVEFDAVRRLFLDRGCHGVVDWWATRRVGSQGEEQDSWMVLIFSTAWQD